MLCCGRQNFCFRPVIPWRGVAKINKETQNGIFHVLKLLARETFLQKFVDLLSGEHQINN